MKSKPNNSISDLKVLKIKGAREHNLQSVDLDLPRENGSQRSPDHTPPAGRAEHQQLWESGQARSQRTPGPK